MASNPAIDYEEWTLSRCPQCHHKVFKSSTGLREVNGQRHVCGNTGEPLVRSHYDNLEQMGRTRSDDLRK